MAVDLALLSRLHRAELAGFPPPLHRWSREEPRSSGSYTFLVEVYDAEDKLVYAAAAVQVKRTNEIGNVYHVFKGHENELEPCWFDGNEEVRVTLFREDGAVAVAFSGAGDGEVVCEEELDGVFDEDNKTVLLYFVRFPLLAPWHSFVDERDYRDMVLERLCIEVSFVKHTKPQTRACRLSDAEFMFYLSNTAHITRAESRTELDDEQTAYALQAARIPWVL